MANKIKAVIFDWGGVVAPNKNGGWVMQLSILLGISFEDALELWRKTSPGLSTGLINEKQFWALAEQNIGKSLPKNKSKIWLDGLASEPYPEIINFVKTLNIKGIKTAVLSNTIEPMERVADLDTMYSDFDEIVLSHRVGIAKPNPEIFNLILDKLNLKYKQCVFVDDSIKNVETAKILGFNTIHIENDPLKTINLIDKLLNNGE